MVKIIVYLLLWAIWPCTISAYAQLSPGALAKAHAHLEGLSNCTQCHELGQHIDNMKCLACHTEIRLRINDKRGFHSTVRDSNCITCHSDHNGRAFEMIHWPNGEMGDFNHDLTCFSLQGEKHQAAQCRDCHQSKNVRSGDILENKKKSLDHTFLGIDPACESCHSDVHNGQFEQTCAVCHDVNEWKVDIKFTHDQARFRLEGKHVSVGCEKCHAKEIISNDPLVSFVRFKPVAFDGCETCHEDVHKGRFEQSCDQCHSSTGWFKSDRRDFDHTLTRFPLVGKHHTISCALCHGQNEKIMRPAFGLCSDCHTDVHLGQFANRLDGGRCDVCHSESGFLPARFDLSMHQNGRFPLAGAHQSVPCMMCHKKNDMDVTQFEWPQEGFLCTDCHNTPHGNQFREQIVQDGCDGCHLVSSWQVVTLDHNATRFPLIGKHQQAKCEQCHKVENIQGFVGRRYVPLSMACEDCHADPHRGQFVRGDITACARCHIEDSWSPKKFNHNRDARFSLEGAHERVDCALCHKVISVDEMPRDRQYKPLDMICASCHGDQN
ncbi:MAG: cytochrome C [Candidatus Latescibacterota bacterium]